MEFSDRAVAFLDILGFSNLMEEIVKRPHLEGEFRQLHSVLDAHARFDNDRLDIAINDAVKPRYLFVSDNIIFSAPLSLSGYDGLSTVVNTASRVAQKLLRIGYLVRGGISVGRIWHTATNIYGNGYIQAVGLEKRAKHPRIILSGEAYQLWKETLHQRITTAVVEFDGEPMVDTLNPIFQPLDFPGAAKDQVLIEYRIQIARRLSDAKLGSDARSKWEWISGFFNWAVSHHHVHVDKFSCLPFPADPV